MKASRKQTEKLAVGIEWRHTSSSFPRRGWSLYGCNPLPKEHLASLRRSITFFTNRVFFCSPFHNCPSSPHRTPKFPTSRHHFNPTATFKALPSSQMTRSTPLSPANISPLREKRRVERPPTSYSAVQQSRIQSTSRSVPPHQHPNRWTPRARGQSTASTCHPSIF